MTADNEAEKDSAPNSHSTTAASATVDHPPAYSGQPPSYQQATNNEAITDDLINLGAAGGLSPHHDSGGSKTSMGSVDLLSDFSDVIGASSTNTSTTVNPSSAALEKSPNSGSGVEHAYSHPKRQEADEQHYQHQISSSSALAAGTGQSSAAGSILPTQQQLHEIYEEN